MNPLHILYYALTWIGALFGMMVIYALFLGLTREFFTQVAYRTVEFYFAEKSKYLDRITEQAQRKMEVEFDRKFN